MDDKSEDQVRKLLSESLLHLAQNRTLLANERTYSAWLRTVLTLTAVAIALPRLFSVAADILFARIIAMVMIIIAEGLLISSALGYYQTNNRLRREHGIISVRPWLFYLTNIILFVAIGLSIIIILR